MLSILGKTIGRQSKSFSQQIGFEILCKICNQKKKKNKSKLTYLEKKRQL